MLSAASRRRASTLGSESVLTLKRFPDADRGAERERERSIERGGDVQ